jgi:hypothetical protein
MSSDGFHNSWLVCLEKKSKIKFLEWIKEGGIIGLALQVRVLSLYPAAVKNTSIQ